MTRQDQPNSAKIYTGSENMSQLCCERGKCEVRLINIDHDNLLFDLAAIRRHERCLESKRSMGKRSDAQIEHDDEMQRLYDRHVATPVMERALAAVFSWWPR